MKIGFHYHVPAEVRQDGRIWIPGYLGRFIDGLAESCERLICFLHTPSDAQREHLDYAIQQSNVELVPIGKHCSVPERLLKARYFTLPLRTRVRELDALLVRGPSPLLPAYVSAARNLPTALLLVGSYVDGVDDLPQPYWRKELIRAWFHLNQFQQDKAASRSLTFVNSRPLYERYIGKVRNVIETRTTTLSEQDFFIREDTCQDKQIRLLYSGRYDRSKGLLEMVRAVALLVQQDFDVVLDLVGWDDSCTNVIDELVALAQQLGVGKRVKDHGRRTVGPDLFSFYRSSDIYVIASKNEGFPRTIWEAMASSLPVVATPVGSIPHFVGDNVELAEPSNHISLASAIAKLITNSELRRARIKSGLEIARSNTLQVRCRELVAGIQAWGLSK